MIRRHTCQVSGMLPRRINDNIQELMALDIEDGDDERYRLVEAIRNLCEEDKRVLCYYAELHSYRKMEMVLGASATTWRREIKRIRDLLIKQL